MHAKRPLRERAADLPCRIYESHSEIVPWSAVCSGMCTSKRDPYPVTTREINNKGDKYTLTTKSQSPRSMTATFPVSTSEIAVQALSMPMSTTTAAASIAGLRGPKSALDESTTIPLALVPVCGVCGMSKSRQSITEVLLQLRVTRACVCGARDSVHVSEIYAYTHVPNTQYY